MTEFERLVASVMSNAFIIDPTPQKKVKKQKRHKLVKLVQSMSLKQLELFILLMEGKLSVLNVKGESYGYRRSDNGWLIRSLHDDEPEHTVFMDFSACSCQDSRFRGVICKHIQALKGVLE